MSSYLRNSILATLVYYDIFDYPLVVGEVHKYLINPGRISMVEGGIGEIGLNETIEELDKLARAGLIGQKNGFYFLGKRESLCQLRAERNKIAVGKWKKFFKAVRPLALAPYLMGIFASGSMALNNTDKESDFDVLVIAKSGRLYTCRFFLWLISSLMGKRRKKHEKIAPDKLCFNHYITDDSLRIPHESIFNAQTYVNLKPVMIESELTDEFYRRNLWLNNYVYNFHPSIPRAALRGLPSEGSPRRLWFVRFMELILNSAMGDKIEQFLKNIQHKKIKSNPTTYEKGGRVIFSDTEIEFHPRSFEKFVIEKYNQNLNKLGIFSYIKETDSGLLQ